MSLLMKWAEQACFSQNHISNLVSVCAGLYPTIEDGLQGSVLLLYTGNSSRGNLFLCGESSC